MDVRGNMAAPSHGEFCEISRITFQVCSRCERGSAQRDVCDLCQLSGGHVFGPLHFAAFFAGGALVNPVVTVVLLFCMTVAGLAIFFNLLTLNEISTREVRFLGLLRPHLGRRTILSSSTTNAEQHLAHGANLHLFSLNQVQRASCSCNSTVLYSQRELIGVVQRLLAPGRTDGASREAKDDFDPRASSTFAAVSLQLDAAALPPNEHLGSRAPYTGQSPTLSSAGSFTESDDFLSVDSSAPASPEQTIRRSPSSRMSDYVIPADADREMLKRLIQETEGKLVAQRALIDHADAASLPGLKRTERRQAEFLQRLETRLSTTTCERMEGTVTKNREDIAGLKQTSERQGEELGQVVDRVTFLEAFCMQLRDKVDQVDNAQHRQNALVYGFELAEPWSVAQHLFKDKSKFVPEVDDMFFLGNDTNKKYPLKIQFKYLTAAREFLEWTGTNEFKAMFPYIGAGRDQTTL